MGIFWQGGIVKISKVIFRKTEGWFDSPLLFGGAWGTRFLRVIL